jgi:uncharacterized protein
MFMTWDPMYYIMIAPAFLLALWAQAKVKWTFASASKIPARCTGALAAQQVMQAAGVFDVEIEQTEGFLSDHYDPRQKVLRLSPDVYSGQSLAALGVGAHEAGHAIQHAHGYAPLALRNAIVPMANFGSGFSWILFFVGLVLQGSKFAVLGYNLVLVGIALFSLMVIFQVINLPVEFNASSRGRQALLATGLVTPEEDGTVRKVLSAAALTYVAATLQSVLTLLYFLYRAGLLGGRRND